ncbi:MAG: DUF3048 domain-containing protein [Acidimicrobiales bacterium]
MRLRVAALASVAVLSLVAAACGGEDGDDVGPDEIGSTTTAPADGSSTTSTAEPSLGPPTTRGPAPTVTVDPIGTLGGISVLAGEPAYRGVLGQIDIDRNIVAPVALPPAAAAEGIAPLTGLALDDPAVQTRPAVLVKIDNTSKGRPQEALTQADLVYEEMIEGGFTRLAVVFHTHAPLMGPIRSGRTTDIALIGSLNEPVFAWSGANLVHAALLRRQPMVDLGAQSRGEYFRSPDRPGTYDLMSEAQTLLDVAADRGDGGAPPPHFEYRDETIGLPSTAEPASTVTVTFPSVTATWDWDADAGGWLRTQGTSEHVDAQGERVVAANVIVAEVRQVATGSVDTAGSTVFEQQFLGSGRGWVFTDGHVIEVTWTKPSLRSVATWTTSDGVPVALTPGVTWVELAPEGATTLA